MSCPLATFAQVWLVDFEFQQPPGETPRVLCMVAREFRTGRLIREWVDGLGDRPPFPISADSLFVAYYASAELECFLSLDWYFPMRVLDLYCEFRCHTNGHRLELGRGLLGALSYFGLRGMAASTKDSMRHLAMRGGEYTASEKAALLDYCQEDVDALAKLLPAMLPHIDIPLAVLRGRYMAAAAKMQYRGVPIDAELLEQFRHNWPEIKHHLIREVDRDYRVYVPSKLQKANPYSKQGQMVYAVADSFGVDARQLVTLAAELAKRYDDNEIHLAIQGARKATGLTPARLARWEDAGRDHSTWPRLDEVARELAAEYPELGIGPAYDAGLFDDTDHAAHLWELLRNPPPRKPRKYDRELLEEAAGHLLDGDYDPGGPMSFSSERFAAWLVANDIPWPRTDNGNLSLSDDTFRQMAKAYPQVAPLRELRHSLSELRLARIFHPLIC